jgi:hypothetical protein
MSDHERPEPIDFYSHGAPRKRNRATDRAARGIGKGKHQGAEGKGMTQREQEMAARKAIDRKQGRPDIDQMRDEFRGLRTMGEEELRNRVVESERRILWLQEELDAGLGTALRAILADPEGAKERFGRGAVTKILQTASKYVAEQRRVSLDNEKLKFLQATALQRLAAEADQSDLAKGITIQVAVQGPAQISANTTHDHHDPKPAALGDRTAREAPRIVP